jgi:uncharacterized protein YjbI with pentapeptide repeats
MANPDHIAQLKKGVTAWNAWRKENPDIRPDLADAELMKDDFFGANLTDTDLTRANLIEANLSAATRSEA